MNDLKPFKHGEEGTHYVCQEVLELKGGKATCCGCSGHKCKKPKPMKRIKKECNCHCHNEFHWFINDKDSCAGITECPHCSPKPMKRIKKEVEKCHCCEWKSPDHLQEDGSCNHCPHHCSPKPTKIKCGLKHKHGYWNCCACCIQGEVKGEGAWGHVKECEFYPKIEIDEFKFAEKRYMLDLGVSREEQALADKLNEVIRAVNKLLSH